MVEHYLADGFKSKPNPVIFEGCQKWQQIFASPDDTRTQNIGYWDKLNVPASKISDVISNVFPAAPIYNIPVLGEIEHDYMRLDDSGQHLG